MPNIGPMIASSARLGLGYARNLLKDIKPEEFARFARVGGTVIESNHPAFILGHLSLYPPRVITELGGDASKITPPQQYEELFSHQAKCVDDPDGSIYPPMDQIMAMMLSGYEAAEQILSVSEDRKFLESNPNERMRERFATKGAMHGFYVGGHLMMHLGQLSAWRRAMGKGPA